MSSPQVSHLLIKRNYSISLDVNCDLKKVKDCILATARFHVECYSNLCVVAVTIIYFLEFKNMEKNKYKIYETP